MPWQFTSCGFGFGLEVDFRRRPMSALGQKRTCAVQKGMSALPPKATLNAFIRMSAMGQ